MDAANKWTDKQLEIIERKMQRVYSQAAKEMNAKQEKALASYAKELEQREKSLDDTPEAMKAHKAWLEEQAAQQKYLSDMANQLAQDATKANQKALAMANDYVPGIYAENANYAAFTIDKAAKVDTMFSLVDENTVRELIKDDVMLLPEVNVSKDLRWNRQKFTSAITQGILQGESIPDIAERIKSVVGMNYNSACGAARLAVTGAENAGRVHSYERAKKLGIELKQEWVATLDGRTRMSHRALDGEKVEVGEKFSNGCRYPGDPTAPGHEIWGCRCTLVAALDGLEDEVAERWSKLPNGMTYEEWKGAKQRASSSGVVDGENILGTWKRRSDQFEFEIEDVMAAQGFDGKPRIVNADEFDRAVRQANGGNGLVMQRSYSAPDQATLDAYRDMLYDGKWYVDCSTGGAQYGQGMYAAADYTGKVTADMQKEMRHYTTLNQGRLGAQPLSDEGKEAFLRKWVGENVAEADRDAAFTYLKFESHTGDVAWADVGKAVEHLGEEKRLSLLESGVHEDVHQMLDGYSYVETMTLDPSAKVVKHNDLQQMYHDENARLLKERETRIAELPTRLAAGEIDATEFARLVGEINAQTEGVSDLGSFAAAMGYDAINAVGHGSSGSYTVVLNRTKLIIKEP